MSCITPVSSSYVVEVHARVRSAASSRRRRRRRGQSEGYKICDHLLLCRTDPWVTSHGGNEFHVCIGACLFVKCFQKISVHFASFVLFLRHFFANFFSIIHDGLTFVGPGDRRERGLWFVRILGSEISPIRLAVVSFRLMRRFSNLRKKNFPLVFPSRALIWGTFHCHRFWTFFLSLSLLLCVSWTSVESGGEWVFVRGFFFGTREG
jgi:hypothetical protein